MDIKPEINNDIFTISKCEIDDVLIDVVNFNVDSESIRVPDLEYSIPVSDERKWIIGNNENIRVYRVWLLPGDKKIKLYSETEEDTVFVYFDEEESRRYRVFSIQSVPIDENLPIEITYHLRNLSDSIGNRPHEAQINGSDFNVNMFDLYEKNKSVYLRNKHYDGRFGPFYISQGFAKYFLGTFKK